MSCKEGLVKGALNGIKKGTVAEWISVEDKLPEKYEQVLCWYEYFRYGDYNCMYETYGIGFYGDGFWGGDIYGTKARVIAWHPLPKPYREKKIT